MQKFQSPEYSAALWERILTTTVAILIIGIGAFLLVRNKPFADPNLVVVARGLFSLAIAVLGATIPGFLNVSWRGSGLLIRAGGALALFVLSYLLTPKVLPALETDRIPPLQNPQRISFFFQPSGQSQSILSPAYAMAMNQKPASKLSPLILRAAYEGDAGRDRRHYDIILSNTSAEQRMLTTFVIRSLYWAGIQPSIGQGLALKPIEKYSIVLMIDKPNRLSEYSNDIYPPIILPPRNESGPSVVSIRLEVVYSFVEPLMSHVNADWDIFYEIGIRDDHGDEVTVLSRRWRRGAAPNWVSEYKRGSWIPPEYRSSRPASPPPK